MKLFAFLLLINLGMVSRGSSSFSKQNNSDVGNIISHTNRINSIVRLISERLESIKVSKDQPLYLSQNTYEDCASLYEDGYTESGVYSIWLATGYRFLPIYCDMETRHPDTNKRGWMVIQRRYNGELNFNRTWQEYVDGFGSPHGEYWIGLENIYQLAGYTEKSFSSRSLRIDLVDQSGTHANANYERFQIFNSTFDYMLDEPLMASSYPNLESGLLASNQKKFTAYDNNNQKMKDFGNCAQTTGGGWWFDMACSWSNLNGRYPKQNEKMSKFSIYWKDWHEISANNDALTNVSMKIQ